MALNLRKLVDESVIAAEALRGPVRLRTLTTLRWLAVAGQLSAILIVHFALGFPVPLGLCLAVIAASAWLNIFTMLRFSSQRYLTDREATAYIAFDIIQLCALLFLTGGLQNPFAVLILAPVTIAASVLPVRLTVLVGSLAFAGVSTLAAFHLPLPWRQDEVVAFPPVLSIGVWVALSLCGRVFRRLRPSNRGRVRRASKRARGVSACARPGGAPCRAWRSCRGRRA